MAVKKKKEKNWYLLIKGKESGPFDYYQVLSKINTGEVSSFDFVKALNQEEWGAVSDHEIFNADAVLAELKSFADIVPISRGERRHTRSPIIADVFIKKDGALIKGKAVEVAKGGMGIEADASFGDGGSVISLYCSPISESIAFNCHAKIVSKVQVSEKMYRYGVQFLKISPKGEMFLYKMLDAIDKLKEAS
ncbi:MAG: PilZ domain-containing protein [Bdellovibrionales bacterium]